MNDIERLLARLIDHEVDFVVIGGFAAVAYGSSVRTQDMDICTDFSPENLLRLQQALAEVHPVHRTHPRRPPLVLTPEGARGWKNLYLDTDEGQLDCLSEVLAIGSYQAVRKHSVEIRPPAGRCRILSLDALIRSKEALDRPRDREAVLQLKAIRERLEQQ